MKKLVIKKIIWNLAQLYNAKFLHLRELIRTQRSSRNGAVYKM